MRPAPFLVLITLGLVAANAAGQSGKLPRDDFNSDPLPDGAVARLGTLRFQPTGYSDDPKDGPKSLRAAINRFLSPTLTALSPDGMSLATAFRHDETTRIAFMDTVSGRTLRGFDVPDLSPQEMQFSADGRNLVCSDWSGISLVDVKTGKRAVPIKREGSPSRESCIALTADNKWVAAQTSGGGYDAPVALWETTTGKQVATLPGRGAMCKGLAFGSDGKRLLLASVVPSYAGKAGMTFDVRSWLAIVCIDVKEQKIIGETSLKPAHQFALGPDGETVALEDPKQDCVRVRHVPTNAERSVIPVKQPKLIFTPDGKALVAIDNNGHAALWDTAAGKKIRDLEGCVANKDFRIVGISSDGKTVAVIDGGWESEPIVVNWNTVTGKRSQRPAGHEGTVTCLAYAPGGTLLASGSVDKTVRLWNPRTGEHLRTLAVHNDTITAVAFSPDTKLVAWSSPRGVTWLSNVADAKAVGSFTGPEKGATTLAFSPEGKVLFAGGNSPEVLAWDIASTKEVVWLKTGHDGAVMAFANGGALALTANGEIRSEDTPERLQLWNPLQKQPIAGMPIGNNDRGTARCDAAVFSADGRMFASSQVSEYQGIRPSYGAARLTTWERASGRPIATLSPAVTTVLSFSPNGRLLAAGAPGQSGHLNIGYGDGIDIWDTLTGKKAGALSVTPQCIAFSPDGRHLATAGRDNCIVIWEAPKTQAPTASKKASAEQQAAWWKTLGGDAADAYKVIRELVDDPEHSVPLLRQHMRPVQLADPAKVAKLIVQLDSETFSDRAKAQAELERMGEGAAHHFEQALKGKISVELRRRLEGLLHQCTPTSINGMRHHRAVATFEWIGTPAAIAQLQGLAQGAPRAHLTLEAQAALKRLRD